MGHAGEDCQPGPSKDGQTAQPDEALQRSDVMEPRTPPAPKRPLPPTHLHSLSSLAMPRPNSVAGRFTTSTVAEPSNLSWGKKSEIKKMFLHFKSIQ